VFEKIQIWLKKENKNHAKTLIQKSGKKYKHNWLPYALKIQPDWLSKGFKSIIDYAFS